MKCGGHYQNGPEKKFSRCDRCSTVSYNHYEGDICDEEMPDDKRVIIIDESGDVRFLYSDELFELARELGIASVRRASFVEPVHLPEVKLGNPFWQVELAPVGGPILGPFDLRKDALEAERRWIEEHDVPEVKS